MIAVAILGVLILVVWYVGLYTSEGYYDKNLYDKASRAIQQLELVQIKRGSISRVALLEPKYLDGNDNVKTVKDMKNVGKKSIWRGNKYVIRAKTQPKFTIPSFVSATQGKGLIVRDDIVLTKAFIVEATGKTWKDTLTKLQKEMEYVRMSIENIARTRGYMTN